MYQKDYNVFFLWFLTVISYLALTKKESNEHEENLPMDSYKRPFLKKLKGRVNLLMVESRYFIFYFCKRVSKLI